MTGKGTMKGHLEVRFICIVCGHAVTLDHGRNILSDAVRWMRMECSRCHGIHSEGVVVAANSPWPR